MMEDPIYNIYEVVDAAKAYFENIDKNKKGSGWKKFQRWLFENEPKFYPSVVIECKLILIMHLKLTRIF